MGSGSPGDEFSKRQGEGTDLDWGKGEASAAPKGDVHVTHPLHVTHLLHMHKVQPKGRNPKCSR